MNSLTVPVLACQLTPSGNQRFVQTSSSLDVNGFCFDVSFTVPESYTGKWDFLKSIYINIALRLGGNTSGTQLALVSNVPLFDLLMYSDFIAGVTMRSTDFTAGSKARISGYIDIGFFTMGSRDALDVSISVGTPVQFNVSMAINAVYRKTLKASIATYNTCKPTGADSPYTNVLQIFYCGDNNELNDNAVIRDELGTKTVNIEDAIAYTNSCGQFEFFERFGMLWEDTFGLSQDVSFRVPIISGDNVPTVLVKRMEFVDGLLSSNYEQSMAELGNLKAKIRENDPVKYNYLLQMGLI